MTTRKPPQPDAADQPTAAPAPAETDGKFPVHEHIGDQLKAMFDEVVRQPVPDRLAELLDELERKQPKN